MCQGADGTEDGQFSPVMAHYFFFTQQPQSPPPGKDGLLISTTPCCLSLTVTQNAAEYDSPNRASLVIEI